MSIILQAMTENIMGCSKDTRNEATQVRDYQKHSFQINITIDAIDNSFLTL